MKTKLLILIGMMTSFVSNSFCQKVYLTEDITVTIPSKFTAIETDKSEHPWVEYYGVADSSRLIIWVIPQEIEMADGRVGVIADRYKDIKNIDTLFFPKPRYQCIDTVREKFYQWTYRYVKKTYRDSTGKYLYTFASKTDDHIVFVDFECMNDDNYAGLDTVLSTMKYKTSISMMVEHIFVTADWRLSIMFLLFVAAFIFIVASEVSIWWKIAVSVLTALLFVATAGIHFVYALIVVLILVAATVYGFYEKYL